jgi:hypothetical protein
MRLKLTPGQSLYLYGVWAPKETLTWSDVLENPTFTLDHLSRSANIPLKLLQQLQPDPSAWARAGRAVLGDCPRMEEWTAHPIRDFRADLGDLVAQRWPADVLVRMGVTYADLVALGLTADSMGLLAHLTLLGWSQLGFARADAAAMSEASLIRLFGMPKQDVLRSLR